MSLLDEKAVFVLQGIADKLGCTTDKLFKVYVDAQVYEGYSHLGVASFFLLLGCWLLYCVANGRPKRVVKSFKEHHTDISNIGVPAAMVGVLCVTVSLLYFIIDGRECVGKVKHPEYYAMRAISADVAKITGKEVKE